MEHGETMPVTPGSLSMKSSGFYVQMFPDVIYQRHMGNRKMYFAVFADGVTREYGKGF